MEQFIKKAARAVDRRSFFRGLGKWGMGAAALAGVLLLPKGSSAQIVLFCNNNGGACADHPVGAPCGPKNDKLCIPTKPGADHCQCVVV